MRKGLAMHAGWLAGVVFAAVLLGLAAVLPGYRHAQHAVDVLGAAQVPHALAWNLLGQLLPGLLLAAFAVALRARLQDQGAGAAARIGGWLLAISGLAFAAAGAFALDLDRMEGPQSKLHVGAQALVMLACVPALLLFTIGLCRLRGWRLVAWAGLPVALALAGLFGPWVWNAWPWRAYPGYTQRLALALYFGWPMLVSLVALRGAGEGGRSPDPGGR